MRKAFDIVPPRSWSGTTPREIPLPKREKDLTVLDVQPHDWHAAQRAVAIPVPAPTKPAGPSFGRRLFLVVRQAGMYLLVGLFSFGFFSALFYGYNRYQDRQRAALEEEPSVSGEQTTTTQPSIRILNGSGSAEQLAALQEALDAKAYDVRSAGTASQSSERTIIYFRTSSEEQALALAADIGQFAPALEKNDDLVGVDDIVILLGSLPNLGQPP